LYIYRKVARKEGKKKEYNELKKKKKNKSIEIDHSTTLFLDKMKNEIKEYEE
jgi:hypothetical protein